MKKITLGVLGGLGPAASARFYSLVTSFTKAECDQDHIDIILHSAASTPDRTAFITGKSRENPLTAMQNSVLTLSRMGADVIAIPCNTAEYFFADLQKITAVPIIRTAFEAAKFAAYLGSNKLGIMATEGTVLAGIYQNACTELGLDFEILSERGQQTLNKIIYQSLKKSLQSPHFSFSSVADELYFKGCDAIVLGCTELSLIEQKEEYEKYNFIDSLAILAAKCVKLCKHELSNSANSYIKKKNQE